MSTTWRPPTRAELEAERRTYTPPDIAAKAEQLLQDIPWDSESEIAARCLVLLYKNTPTTERKPQ